MHLLAAKPGGFVDDEGIIDLEQTPAELIILSAADTSLAALAKAAESMTDDYPSIRLANWMQLLKPAAFDLYQEKVIDHARVIIVSLLGGHSYWPYGLECLQDWAKQENNILIVVPGDDPEQIQNSPHLENLDTYGDVICIPTDLEPWWKKSAAPKMRIF